MEFLSFLTIFIQFTIFIHWRHSKFYIYFFKGKKKIKIEGKLKKIPGKTFPIFAGHKLFNIIQALFFQFSSSFNNGIKKTFPTVWRKR